jgi:hypothetical protein
MREISHLRLMMKLIIFGIGVKIDFPHTANISSILGIFKMRFIWDTTRSLLAICIDLLEIRVLNIFANTNI